MPRSRFHFTEPEHRKRHVGVDDRIVRVITLLVLIGLVAGIDYVHPAFLYR